MMYYYIYIYIYITIIKPNNIRKDSNLQPSVPKTETLAIELRMPLLYY